MKLRPSMSRSDAVLLGSAIAVIVALVLASTLAAARSIGDRARSVEGQLRCPTCQGLSIADSPATSAAQMRALVDEQLAAGASDDAIRAFFVARYGRWILLDPPFSGPDVALWIVPAAIVATGALLVARRVRRPGPGTIARTWHVLPASSGSRLGIAVVGVSMALALAVPIAAAVGPRLAGAQVSGGVSPQASPSIEDLEAFVRAEPRDVEALVALGDALLAANAPGEAADRFKSALEIDPKSVDALLGLGTILLGAGRPDAAGPVFDRILAIEPDQPDALLFRAVARFRLDGPGSNLARGDVEHFLAVVSADDPRREMAIQMLSSPAASSAEPSGTPSPKSSQP